MANCTVSVRDDLVTRFPVKHWIMSTVFFLRVTNPNNVQRFSMSVLCPEVYLVVLCLSVSVQ